MTMRKQITDVLTIAVVAMAIPGVNTNAADITYEGFQANVELKADDPATGWRNPSPAKPLDLDGDNILGSDGYYAFQSAISDLPSYISAWQLTVSGNNWGTGWGVADDPADPTGADTKPFGRWQPQASGDLFNFVITGSDLDGKVLTVGVLYDTLGTVDVTIELKQTVGGSATATSPLLAVDGDGANVAYFNVTGAQAGDKFNVVGTPLGQFGGFTFDTSSGGPPPPSAGGTVIPKTIEAIDTFGTLQWQASADGATFTNLVGETSGVLDISALYAATPWFRVEATSGTNAPAYSKPIKVITQADGTVIYVR